MAYDHVPTIDPATGLFYPALQSAQDTRNAANTVDSTARAAIATKATSPDLLAVSTTPVALTQDKIQPFNATAGAITATALPALSGLTVGATYWVQKTDTTASTVTVPYASGDTSDTGLAAATLPMAELVQLQVVSNPAGGMFWKAIGSLKSTAAQDARYAQVSSVNTASGIAGLDGTGLIGSSQMRPFNWRGQVANNTAYNPWDTVQLINGYGSRIVLITAAVTSGGTGFISGSKYVPLQGYSPWINVKDYGAKGDGVTDDTTAIQAAITAAASSAASTGGGGTVFFPAGYYMTSAPIVLQQHVWIRGEGMRQSVIKLMTNANCHVVQNYFPPTTSGVNAEFCGVLDMDIDGNRANQNGAGPYYGIYFNTNPATSTASGDFFFDQHHVIQNVTVYRAQSDGVHLVGRSAIQLVNVFSQGCNGYGFYSTFDTNFTHCESDSAGLSGFYLNNGSIRLAACKSYLSGQVDGLGSGFEFGSNANGVTLAACEAQNNQGRGFYLNGANRANITGIADSNNYTNTNAYSAVELVGSSDNIIQVVAWQGKQGGTQIGNQGTALAIDSTSKANSITLSHSAQSGVTGFSTLVTSGSALDASNFVVGNGAILSAGGGTSAPTSGQFLGFNGTKWTAASAPGTNYGNVFGDGSDGVLNLDGTNTYSVVMSKSGSVYTLTKDVNAASFTVASGVTLNSNGYRILVQGTFTNNGTVQNIGNTGTAAGLAGTTSSSGMIAGGMAGGAGNTGAGTAGSQGGFGVGSGGAGGAGGTGAAGAGGFTVNSNTFMFKNPQGILTGTLAFSNTVFPIRGGAGGGGGGGDATNKGGGGGSGGGIVVVLAYAVVNAGTITVVGGAGGTPTVGNTGGGGGGGGGLILTYSLTAWTAGTTAVTGGAAGTGVGTGATGIAGSGGFVLNVVVV